MRKFGNSQGFSSLNSNISSYVLIHFVTIHVRCLMFVAARRHPEEKYVIIDPPNIITNPVKKGPSIDACLFSKPTYNAVGEPFKEAGKQMMGRKFDRTKVAEAGHEV